MAEEQASIGVPDEVAVAVAAFLRQRASDSEGWAGEGTGNSAQGREQVALVRHWERARSLKRLVTAENLALTMLAAAARYRTDRRYDPVWDLWQAFGDLEPPPHE